MEELTNEEYVQFIDELWDLGIPPVSLEEWTTFYLKWKDKVDMPVPSQDLLNQFI